MTDITSQKLILSPEEHKVAEQYLAKLELSATTGKKKKWFLLIVLIIASIQGTILNIAGGGDCQATTRSLNV